MTLSIATLNILDDLSYWEERAPLILACFGALRPDVIALQEVPLSLCSEGSREDESAAHWLAGRLGGYEVFLCPGGAHPASDSLAVLTSCPARPTGVLALGAQGRQAQRVEVSHGSGRWIIVNTHLHWNPFFDATREDQAARLLEWADQDFPVVVCGDFNASPTSGTLRRLSTRFVSAHKAANGREPILTYPTMLRRGSGPRHWGRHAALRANGIVRRRRNIRYGGTVDYIMVDRGVVVRSCEVILDRPSAQDARIFASDHLGLRAVLEAPARERP